MKLGWAVGRVLRDIGQNDRVLIGKDTRISGDMLEAALKAGLSAMGLHVALLGTLPTAGIAYLTRSTSACAGVVISASHNLYPDNGIKLFSGQGTKLDDDMLAAIDAAMREDIICVDSECLGRVERFPEAREQYVQHCLSTFPRALIPLDLKMVLDCAHGACYQVAPQVLRQLGADVVVIGDQPDGLNINAGCGSTHLETVRESVLEHDAQVGMALDGDGDRVLLVDETGSVVNGDQILYLLAAHRQRKGILGGGVVGTLMTNLGLQEALAKLDIPFRRTKVGDRYVQETLTQHGWWLGGETSGHILCLDKSTTGDGIVSALEVLQVMRETGNTLSELVSGMPVYPQQIINVPVEDVDVHRLVRNAGIQASVHTAQAELGRHGRVVLHPSGTEPLLRVMIEGGDALQVDRLVRLIAREVESVVEAS